MATLVPPLLVLRARAEAQAMLFAAGHVEFEDAIEVLRLYAIESGLTAKLGTETIDALIYDPFKLHIQQQAH
jgi:hypothetical protein